MNDRLYRSTSDRMLAGVVGGLADRLDLDPSLVRVGWVLLTIVSGGIFFVIYIVMWLVVPEEPEGWVPGWASGAPAGPGEPGGPAAGAAAGTAAGAAMGGPAGGPAMAPTAESGPTPGPVPAGGPSVVGGPALAGPGPAGPSGPGWTAGPGWAGGPAGPGWTSGSDAWSRQARREARRTARRARRDSGSGALVIGVILILVGAYALARTFIPELQLDRYWPAALVVLGVILIASSLRRNPPNPN